VIDLKNVTAISQEGEDLLVELISERSNSAVAYLPNV
jgi:hypothetical protein